MDPDGASHDPVGDPGAAAETDAVVAEDTADRLKSVDAVVRRRIQDWAKRLIDLSRRNRLLYFRPTKRTTLHLVEPNANEIAEKLLRGGSWRFYEPGSDGADEPFASVSESLQAVPRDSREVVTHHTELKELKRSLEVISRRARAEFEDRGTHVLQLAYGLVHWQDDRGGGPVQSPLLLIPCEVKRESVRDPWTLKAAEDDPFLNPALRVKFQSDFGLQLPEYDEFDELNLSDMLADVQSSLTTGWRVEPAAYVGIYGFAKEAMYRDLVDHIDIVAKDSQVQTLAHGRPIGDTLEALSIAVPTESQLDRVQDPAATLSVLDADSSQREAIEAAVAGLSFVMQGPPGTGKSQTIANIIAEFIGRGRSVLFVSEKIAALEVVANRLAEAGLEDMFLELHSQKSSRKEVATELGRVLDEDVLPNADLSPAELDLLRNSRTQLNDYVQALHAIRSPYGRTARAVLAELTSLQSAPGLPAPAVDAATATAQELMVVEGLIGRLAAAWAPAEPHTEFLWREAAHSSYGGAERRTTMRTVTGASDAIKELRDHERTIVSMLRIPEPGSPADRSQLLALGDLVAASAPVPSWWLTDADLTAPRAVVEEWTSLSDQRNQSIRLLAGAYADEWRSIPGDLEAPLRHAEMNLAKGLGTDALDDVGVVANLASLGVAADQVSGRLETAASVVVDLAPLLGLRAPLVDIQQLDGMAEVARASLSAHRPPSHWFGRSRLDEAREYMQREAIRYRSFQQGRSTLATDYNVDAMLSLDLKPLLARLEARQGRWWSFLSSSHRRDRRAIRELRRDRRIPATFVVDVKTAVGLDEDRDYLLRQSAVEQRLLGPYAAGVATDTDAVMDALGVADALTASEYVSDWERLSATASHGAPYDPKVDRLTEQLEKLSASIREALIVLATGSGDRLGLWRQAAVKDVRESAMLVATSTSALAAHLERVRTIRQSPVTTLEELHRELMSRAQIASLDMRLEAESHIVKETLGILYAGWETDWGAAASTLDWVNAVRTLCGESPLQPAAAEAVIDGSAARLPWKRYDESLKSGHLAATAVTELFEGSREPDLRASLEGRLDDALVLLQRLSDDAEQIGVWVAFRAARGAAQDAGWGDFIDQAESAVAAAALLPGARRAWLESWVESAIESDPALKPFTRQEHERLSATFGELDVAVIRAARERVLTAYAEGKPHVFAVQGGEQAVVRREAAKKKRHLPVRRLFEQIPNLLTRIKPCLMMSPLSVSHFLPGEARFDLVVFDEASQVPPEDAINCIYRGAQLIVAGDQHQLPPTDFFQVAADLEADEEADFQVDDFESILDVCRASGFRVVPLRWHYRSRHDELIAFSNHYIYENSLVTFPAAVVADAVRLEYVPDGIFDRGRTSKNGIEATRVADVLTGLLNEGHRSIGVVAFSMAQQEAINDELERRRGMDTRLDELLQGDRLSGVFVKNLETVQGDERDFIVFSIGYGRDASGRFLMNFGPLNRQGGKRRLNVAVTRAREQVVVVSSVRASDFGNPESDGGPKSEGPRLLQAYLDYADRGMAALRDHLDASQGDFESEFEREVANVIRSTGFEAVPQVGASRYRIDIGVRSRLIPGRFVLGVECDGAMYHSAKTARDRDRLRQRVLENLGWRIHRVWSQDWFTNRAAEEVRLKSAIEGAEAELAEATAKSPQHQALPPTPEIQQRTRVARDSVEVADSYDAYSLPWTTPYVIADIDSYQRWGEFHEWVMHEQHARRVAQLVEAEGPLHQDYIALRLSRAFGLARTGSRIRDATQSAIRANESAGQVLVRGSFVWPPGFSFKDVRIPVPGVGETYRDISEIPPEEVDLAILRVTEAAMSIDAAHLTTQVARILGFDRTGGNVGELIRRRIKANLKNGSLGGHDAALVLAAHLPALSRLSIVQPSTDSLPTETLEGFFEGQAVEHPRFGVGIVREVGAKYITVAFADVVKEIDPALASIEVLD